MVSLDPVSRSRVIDRVREQRTVADEALREIEVHRQRVLQGVVYGAVYRHYRVCSRSEREGLPGASELPDRLSERDGFLKELRIVAPRIAGRGVPREQDAEAEAVQPGCLGVVVMDYEVFVGLVGAFLRILAAAAGIYLLDDHRSCL